MLQYVMVDEGPSWPVTQTYVRAPKSALGQAGDAVGKFYDEHKVGIWLGGSVVGALALLGIFSWIRG